MATQRGRHWTDVLVGGQARRRRIGTHLNYVSPGGLLLPTQSHIAESGPPANWVGQWDFRDHSGAAPLQFSAHDTSDPDNRAMIGLRIDDTPDAWANLKAMDVVAGVETQSPSDTVREWPGLWANSTLRWSHEGHMARKEIVLSSAGHPASFRFSVRTSPGSTWDVANGMLTLRQGGVKKLRTQPAFGWDANGNYIRATLTLDDTWGPGGSYPILRLTPNADDLSGATYPVVIDPTATIDDTGIEDFWMNEGVGNNNYGAASTLSVREVGGGARTSVNRVDESLIPAGTINGVIFNFRVSTAGTQTSEAYKVAAANAGYVEGTATGAAQTGSPCWNYYAYDASSPTNWAGSGGMETSGTDYVADASPPSFSGWTSTGDKNWDMGATAAAWFTDWRDTPANNAGVKIVGTTSGNTAMYSTEASSAFRPSYDIDYTAPAAGQPAWIRWTPIHVAGRGGFARGSF